MTIKQISIFVENKPEALAKLTGVLADNKINLKALSLADTSDFGVARIIVDDCDAVAKVLQANDYIVKVTGVIAAEVADEAGSLNKILTILSENGRNVEYMYGFTGHKTNTACMIIRTTDIPATEKIFEANKVKMISEEELKNL